MSARRRNRRHPLPDSPTAPPSRLRRRIWIALAWLATAGLAGAGVSRWPTHETGWAGDRNVATSLVDCKDSGELSRRASSRRPRSLQDLLALPDGEFEKLDIIEVNLAIAREIPMCRDLNVAQYQRIVDQWAESVKHEIDRHWYRFEASPADYKHSRAYFQALMMCTVIGQDFGIGYDLADFSFAQPEDLFVHGVIDNRKGTCVSLPVLYIAIAQRLGFPIKAVAVPGHTFCRWDDPDTSERLNIEAANLGGLTDHDDEYYRHWPYEIDPRWETTHHVLTSLTMRQHASVMLGALAGYHAAQEDYAAMIRWDAVAHWLDPANRSAFVSLWLGVEHSLERYVDADEITRPGAYRYLRPHSSLRTNVAPSHSAPNTLDTGSSSVFNQGGTP